MSLGRVNDKSCGEGGRSSIMIVSEKVDISINIPGAI
jgi:hypothetical protein